MKNLKTANATTKIRFKYELKAHHTSLKLIGVSICSVSIENSSKPTSFSVRSFFCLTGRRRPSPGTVGTHKPTERALVHGIKLRLEFSELVLYLQQQPRLQVG